MNVSYTKNFIKQSKKLSTRQRVQLLERIRLFLKNPSAAQLHDHQLTGRYRAYRSINITGDVRALYLHKEGEAVFGIIGTHGQLYS